MGAFAIFGNPSVTNTSLKYVGELGNVDGAGAFSFVASAVAIDPFWILTARHIDGNAIRIDGKVYNAASGQDFIDPDSDLRLIKVTSAIASYVPLARTDAVGKVARLIGYGGTGTGITGNAYNVGGPDGARHRARNVLDATEGISFDAGQTPWNAYRYDLDDPNQAGNGYVNGEGGVWFGDSGGAWVVDGASGGDELVAISSAVYNPAFPDGGHENEFGSFGYGTRVLDRTSFIAQHVPGAVPEPATMTAFGFGAIALIRRRPRKTKA